MIVKEKFHITDKMFRESIQKRKTSLFSTVERAELFPAVFTSTQKMSSVTQTLSGSCILSSNYTETFDKATIQVLVFSQKFVHSSLTYE